MTLLPEWSLGPVVEALQALCGVAPVIAAGVVAEVGDMRRFDSPRQLMAYLGLVPGEHSTEKHAGLLVSARSVAPIFRYGSGSSDVLHALLEHRETPFRLLVGHSKGRGRSTMRSNPFPSSGRRGCAW